MAENSAHLKTTGSKQGGRLGMELAFLFGERVVAKSRELSADAVVAEAERVADAANRMQAHKGQPEEQRRIVQGMDEQAAAALCRWIQVIR